MASPAPSCRPAQLLCTGHDHGRVHVLGSWAGQEGLPRCAGAAKCRCTVCEHQRLRHAQLLVLQAWGVRARQAAALRALGPGSGAGRETAVVMAGRRTRGWRWVEQGGAGPGTLRVASPRDQDIWCRHVQEGAVGTTAVHTWYSWSYTTDDFVFV